MLISIFVVILSILPFGKSTFIWSSTDEWSTCSKPCGEGEETQIFICLKKTHYRTLEYSNSSKCSIQERPNITRKCSYGKCDEKPTGSFVWQVGNWSLCPRQCGKSSLQSRDVNCYMMTTKGEYLLAKLSKCDSKLEPSRFLSCAKADCPPKFLTSKWNKCPETTDCVPKIRRREVKCVSLLSSGKFKVQAPGICYRLRQHPPSSWMFCSSDMNQNCLDMKISNKKLNEKIKIRQENSEIHQMRQTKRLNVYVGQTAHVFGFARLSIFCPVSNMQRNRIQWEHGNKNYVFNGNSKDRIKVNRKGVLIIREFFLVDTGVWRCRAGKFTADAILHLEQPSTGFDNWLKRHANTNYGMVNEESNVSFIRPESIVWIKSDWTSCSLNCEADENNVGYQSRKVTCEKIESQYYKIIDDKFCPSIKPISSKKCKATEKCPIWIVNKNKEEKCSDVCVNVGLARTNAEILCQYNNRTVDPSFCDKNKLPNLTCPNSQCQISYHYGPWSQCSLSCSNTTNTSTRSRTMKCVWKDTVNPAYHLCQQSQLLHRPLVKPCRVPKCILGCRDLTPACAKQSKYRCRSSLFYHFCCAFCKKQFS